MPNQTTHRTLSLQGAAGSLRDFNIPDNLFNLALEAAARVLRAFEKGHAPPPVIKDRNARPLFVSSHDPEFFKRNPGTQVFEAGSQFPSQKDAAEALGSSYVQLVRNNSAARKRGEPGFWCRGHFLRFQEDVR